MLSLFAVVIAIAGAAVHVRRSPDSGMLQTLFDVVALSGAMVLVELVLLGLIRELPDEHQTPLVLVVAVVASATWLAVVAPRWAERVARVATLLRAGWVPPRPLLLTAGTALFGAIFAAGVIRPPDVPEGVYLGLTLILIGANVVAELRVVRRLRLEMEALADEDPGEHQALLADSGALTMTAGLGVGVAGLLLVFSGLGPFGTPLPTHSLITTPVGSVLMFAGTAVMLRGSRELNRAASASSPEPL